MHAPFGGRWHKSENLRRWYSIPGRAAYAVTLKTGQHVSAVGDRQGQEVSGGVQIKGMLDGGREAVG